VGGGSCEAPPYPDMVIFIYQVVLATLIDAITLQMKKMDKKNIITYVFI
jgi:hypothetical protein